MTIPGQNTDTRQRVIPGNADPTFSDGKHFHSYTDAFEPKDQKDRDLFKVTEGTTDTFEAFRGRLYRMIQARGEEVYYVRRKIDGDRCFCWDPEARTSRRRRCSQCFGTGIVGGYVRYVSARNATHDGKIWIAAPMGQAELQMQPAGFNALQEYSYWTLPIPVVSDPDIRNPRTYDWLVRYQKDGTELGRYWVVRTSISYFNENVEMHVGIDAKLADAQEVIYGIDVATLGTVAGP